MLFISTDSFEETLETHDLVVGCVPIRRSQDVVVGSFDMIRGHLKRFEPLDELGKLSNSHHVHHLSWQPNPSLEHVELYVTTGLDFIHDRLCFSESSDKIRVVMLYLLGINIRNIKHNLC